MKERWFNLKTLNLIRKYGFNNLKQCVAEGQFEYPKAIQYGGDCLQPGPELLLGWLDKTLEGVNRIWAIDLHTGLGPSGYDTILVPDDISSSNYKILQKLFGDHVAALDPGKSRIRKILESGALIADPLARGLGLYKKGGRVGCGVAKKGFGKAMKKRRK